MDRRTGLSLIVDLYRSAATLAPVPQFRLPWRADFNALDIPAGRARLGRHAAAAGAPAELTLFGPGEVVTVAADARQKSRSRQLDVLVLGGLPIRESVAAYGPFVMNTMEAELIQAFDDYQAGRLGTIPAVPVRWSRAPAMRPLTTPRSQRALPATGPGRTRPRWRRQRDTPGQIGPFIL
jgi:hypothetical protein